MISPLLANIYLHYVLDLWFTEVVKPRCKARAFMCRFADDVVFAFQWREEAERFFQVLPGWGGMGCGGRPWLKQCSRGHFTAARLQQKTILVPP